MKQLHGVRAAILLVCGGVMACAPLTRLIRPRDSDAGLPVHEGYVVTDDGASLFYRVVGGGGGRDTVVVVHGGPGTSMAVLGNLEPLAAGGTLIFYDQRGGGRSSLPTHASQLTAPRFVADLEAVRAHFQLQRMTILGHSWGALLTGLYAVAHPDRVARMVLVAPIALSEERARTTRTGNVLSAEQSARLRTLIAATDTATDQPAICRETQALRVLSGGHDSTVARRAAERICGHSPPAALREGRSRTPAAVFASLGAFDLRSGLRTVRAPALIILGERDPIPRAVGREWATALPNGRVEVVPRAGHFIFEDDPVAFATLIREFFGRD